MTHTPSALKDVEKALSQISRMRTLPDHTSNTITLVVAHQIAESALTTLRAYMAAQAHALDAVKVLEEICKRAAYRLQSAIAFIDEYLLDKNCHSYVPNSIGENARAKMNILIDIQNCLENSSPATSPEDGWRTIDNGTPINEKMLIGCWHNGKWYEDVGTLWGKQGRRTICVGFRKNEWPTHCRDLPKPPTMQGVNDG